MDIVCEVFRQSQNIYPPAIGEGSLNIVYLRIHSNLTGAYALKYNHRTGPLHFVHLVSQPDRGEWNNGQMVICLHFPVTVGKQRVHHMMVQLVIIID